MRLKKKQVVVRKYKDIFTYICPVRGEVSEEKEILVYGTDNQLDEEETVNLEEITY